jgi:hypothetical protein
VTDEKEKPMMALAIVVELAYRTATNGQDGDEKTLNNIARAIAACIDIFEFPVPTSDGQPKLLTHDEVRQGHFGGGGLTLKFNDGRPDRRNLCIQLTDLSRAIVEVNRFFKSTN